MKTKVFFFTLLMIATSCMISAQNLQGTWKSLESSGRSTPEGYSTLKHITPTHFMWTMFDKEGNIITGAGGTYTLKDGVYTETILYTLPGMQSYKGRNAAFNVKVEGNILSMSGHLEVKKDAKLQFTEKWEKIE